VTDLIQMLSKLFGLQIRGAKCAALTAANAGHMPCRMPRYARQAMSDPIEMCPPLQRHGCRGPLQSSNETVITSLPEMAGGDADRLPASGCGSVHAAALVALLAGILALSAAPASAATAAPGWTISSTAQPTNFAPGSTGNVYALTVMNSGGAPADGSSGPITVSDTLPAGLTATAISGTNAAGNDISSSCSLATVSCTLSSVVDPGGGIFIYVQVSVAPGTPGSVTNAATVSGGGATPASTTEATTVSSIPAGFGIQGFTTSVKDADGSLATQAGAHPYAASATFFLNTVPSGDGVDFLPAQNLKDAAVSLPPGFIGNPTSVPQCPRALFPPTAEQGCSADSQVGVATIFFSGSSWQQEPVYNMVPEDGAPADFAFQVEGIATHIVGQVRSGGDYGVTTLSPDLTELAPVTGFSLTFWGVPGDPSHDWQRGQRGNCGTGFGGSCGPGSPFTGIAAKPFLTNPTLCGPPLPTTLSADSWQSQGVFASPPPTLSPGPTGCDRLSFQPSVSLTPDTTQAGAPTGLSVDLSVPQTDSRTTLSTPELRNATVTLPPGMTVSPSAADGLQGCSDAQIDLSSAAPGSCPPASQIGTATIHTPLLDHPLLGDVYLGAPLCGPCTDADAVSGRMLRLFIEVDDPISGIVVKLPGTVSADATTGQLTASFKDNPQLPFDDLKLQFKSGPRAPLANPTRCGTYTTTTDLSPWSAPFTPDATPSSSFEIIGCGNPNQFSPSFTAGVQNVQAGAFSPFVLSFSRSDTDQELLSISVTLPPGLLAKLAGVPLCSDANANAGTCPATSQVGTVATGAGPGAQPFFVPGKAYLTGPYKGGPYGLAVVVPAVAGPFDLGTVVVRQSLRIDRTTAQVTAVSDPFPTILHGIPLRIRRVDVTVDRPSFMLNPTSCDPVAISGTLSSTGGLTATVTSRFQVGGCGELPFRPSFTVSTQGKTSKANGASVTVKLVQKHGEANIHKVNLQLPLALPSRLTTLQKACTEAQLNANPAGCPAGSNIGMATAVTPVLNVPLIGPAYLVSHGGAAFPDVEFVLQGEGVEVVLDGKTNIKKGITYSNFETVPDAPISSFETVLPEGPHSVLAAVGNLCTQSLVMPTTITGQNGAQLRQNTQIVVTGCGKPSIKITKATIKGNTLFLTVTTTQQGTVTVSGYGLKLIKKTLSAGAHQLEVSLTKNGRTARRHHKKTDVKAGVKDSNGSSSKTKTLKL
jgi:hypothetical protein